MSWSEKRIVTILSGILAVLCAALLIVLGIRYRENRAEPEAEIPVVSGENGQQQEAAFTALSYTNGSVTLSFSLNESGTWFWSDDPDFPLDAATVTAITDLLTAWDPRETITDEETLAACGFAQPLAKLAATTPTSGTLTLEFGRATEDKTAHYVRLNEDDARAFVVEDSLYQLLQVPIYDMYRLPELPPLTDETLRSVIVRGAPAEDGTPAAGTILTAQHTEGETSVTWRSSGANVTDDPAIRALLADIAALQYEKCILYRPSAEAASICGFDAPANLWVSYTAAGLDGELSLDIGAPLPDGSGRYVRPESEDVVYLVRAELLDPLLSIAAEGLE